MPRRIRHLRHHRSSRRAPPLKDSDFDHEITLVDRDDEDGSDRPPSAAGRQPANGNGGPSGNQVTDGAAQPPVRLEGPTAQEETGRPKSVETATKGTNRAGPPESAIDILYENQRGCFLCGMPLFSSRALGNLDPPPWTNYAHRPSPTDIHTAQVPDPSWEWAWGEWRINHDDGVDRDGWTYSFAFSSKFSWHKARWWNSFVRRRVWIRKRVKKDAAQDPHLLNPDYYFTVRPSSDISRDRSPSKASSRPGSRLSTGTADGEHAGQPAIEDADELLRVLRVCRIDREKIEAIENYLENARDDLGGLRDIMHEIMSLFVFQASRRVLLTRLTEVHDDAAGRRAEAAGASPGLERRADNLAEAVRHADEEVRRLEYWSDVKGMAEEGDSKGAVDQKQGWDPSWRGVDRSGPSAPPAPPKRTDGAEGPGTDSTA